MSKHVIHFLSKIIMKKNEHYLDVFQDKTVKGIGSQRFLIIEKYKSQ